MEQSLTEPRVICAIAGMDRKPTHQPLGLILFWWTQSRETDTAMKMGGQDAEIHYLTDSTVFTQNCFNLKQHKEEIW
jgi:hypothetical protein